MPTNTAIKVSADTLRLYNAPLLVITMLRNTMRLLSLLFILLSLVLSLGACGLKGDLVIPENQQPTEQEQQTEQ